MKSLRFIATALAVFCYFGTIFRSAWGHRTNRETIPTLFYFNAPETVRRAGILGKCLLPPGKSSRLFFHFKNATGMSQVFRMRISGSPVIFRRLGIFVAQEPGLAGSTAARDFLASRPTPRSHGDTMVSARVPHGHTVSGILEFTPLSPTGARATVSIGGERRDPADWSISMSRQLLILETTELSTGAGIRVRIGGNQTTPYRIAGDYGTIYRLRFHNASDSPQRLTLSVSPRGGDANFVYRVRGVVRLTPVVPASKELLFFSVTLGPSGVLELDTMPIGGWCYPVEVRVRSAPV